MDTETNTTKGKKMDNYQIEKINGELDSAEAELQYNEHLRKAAKRAGITINVVFAPIWFITAVATNSLWPFLLVSLFGVFFIALHVLTGMAMSTAVTEKQGEVDKLNKALNRALMGDAGFNPYYPN